MPSARQPLSQSLKRDSLRALPLPTLTPPRPTRDATKPLHPTARTRPKSTQNLHPKLLRNRQIASRTTKTNTSAPFLSVHDTPDTLNCGIAVFPPESLKWGVFWDMKEGGG